MLPGDLAALPDGVAGDPGGRDVLAQVGVGQGAGEQVHRVVHQRGLGLKERHDSAVLWAVRPPGGGLLLTSCRFRQISKFTSLVRSCQQLIWAGNVQFLP